MRRRAASGAGRLAVIARQRARDEATDSVSGMESVEVCPVAELPNGGRKRIEAEDMQILVINCDGQFLAIEDRCSHDGAPLDDGPVNCAAGTIECPRHGSIFDLRTGRPKTLPAYMPVESFEVEVVDGIVRVLVD